MQVRNRYSNVFHERPSRGASANSCFQRDKRLCADHLLRENHFHMVLFSNVPTVVDLFGVTYVRLEIQDTPLLWFCGNEQVWWRGELVYSGKSCKEA